MNEKYLKYVNDFNGGDIDHLIDMFDNVGNILKFFHAISNKTFFWSIY